VSDDEVRLAVDGPATEPICRKCSEYAIKAGKWEGRFFLLLVAHERALRLIEEASRD
jgi:hypothetical protein